MKGRVLFVDDDEAMCAMLATRLEKRSYVVVTHSDGAEAFNTLRAHDFDVVVTDLNMRGMGGLELTERIVADRPDIPVVLITAFGSLDTAIAAIRAGAYDFVPKPFVLDALCVAIDRAIQHRVLRQEITRLREKVVMLRSDRDLAGDSPEMLRVHDLIDRLRSSDSSVLISGESGTGKELVAKMLHSKSRRSEGPFVAINCAAMPEHLLESELFGHTRGAFTDAKVARTGMFLAANGGTLFLDEIGEIPIALQPKLLRALQERKIRPLGSDREVPFDARIVAATNRDLETAIAEGRFREDLYYRLGVIVLSLPPLRMRGNDILLLAQMFIERHSALAEKRVVGLSPTAAEKLIAYSWPGNVRELQNCIERAVAFSQYDRIVAEDLPEKIQQFRRADLVLIANDPQDLKTMDEVERQYIERVLQSAAGNKTVAARILGFDRTTLYRKMERYGLSEDVSD